MHQNKTSKQASMHTFEQTSLQQRTLPHLSMHTKQQTFQAYIQNTANTANSITEHTSNHKLND